MLDRRKPDKTVGRGTKTPPTDVAATFDEEVVLGIVEGVPFREVVVVVGQVEGQEDLTHVVKVLRLLEVVARGVGRPPGKLRLRPGRLAPGHAVVHTARPRPLRRVGLGHVDARLRRLCPVLAPARLSHSTVCYFRKTFLVGRDAYHDYDHDKHDR